MVKPLVCMINSENHKNILFYHDLKIHPCKYSHQHCMQIYAHTFVKALCAHLRICLQIVKFQYANGCLCAHIFLEFQRKKSEIIRPPPLSPIINVCSCYKSGSLINGIFFYWKRTYVKQIKICFSIKYGRYWNATKFFITH